MGHGHTDGEDYFLNTLRIVPKEVYEGKVDVISVEHESIDFFRFLFKGPTREVFFKREADKSGYSDEGGLPLGRPVLQGTRSPFFLSSCLED